MRNLYVKCTFSSLLFSFITVMYAIRVPSPLLVPAIIGSRGRCITKVGIVVELVVAECSTSGGLADGNKREGERRDMQIDGGRKNDQRR